MKINMPSNNRRRPRPDSPSVNLTPEAYDTLMSLAIRHNVSMRKLASEIILQAGEELEVVRNDG